MFKKKAPEVLGAARGLFDGCWLLQNLAATKYKHHNRSNVSDLINETEDLQPLGVGTVEADHTKHGRKNSDFNLGVGIV